MLTRLVLLLYLQMVEWVIMKYQTFNDLENSVPIKVKSAFLNLRPIDWGGCLITWCILHVFTVAISSCVWAHINLHTTKFLSICACVYACSRVSYFKGDKKLKHRIGVASRMEPPSGFVIKAEPKRSNSYLLRFCVWWHTLSKYEETVKTSCRLGCMNAEASQLSTYLIEDALFVEVQYGVCGQAWFYNIEMF